MDEHLKKELKDYFLIFGAENSISEPDLEKLERVLHEFALKDLEEVKEICEYIITKKLQGLTEDEIFEAVEKSGLFKKA